MTIGMAHPTERSTRAEDGARLLDESDVRVTRVNVSRGRIAAESGHRPRRACVRSIEEHMPKNRRVEIQATSQPMSSHEERQFAVLLEALIGSLVDAELK